MRENEDDFSMFEDAGTFGRNAVDQNAALSNIIKTSPTQQAVTPATPKTPLTFADLTKLYNEKGATTRRDVMEGEEMKTYYDPTDLGEGWNAWEKAGNQIGLEGQGENATPIYSPSSLGGFSRKDGDYVNFYDTSGKLVDRQKWNDSALKMAWKDVGPVAMAALTMAPGAAAALGSAIAPSLSGAAAAGLGGALGGGFNAAMNDQNILKGALKGGISGAGAAELGKLDSGKAITLGDVNKAVNFAKDPTLAGAAGMASDYLGGNMPDMKIGDTGLSVSDLVKNAGTAQALASGDPLKMFNAIRGLAGSSGDKLKLGLGPGDPQEFSDNLIEGYFSPGGEGYAGEEQGQEDSGAESSDVEESVFDPTFGGALPLDGEYSVAGNADEMTVREDPENLDAFLRELSPYQSDTESGKSVFAEDEDIPEFETTEKRGVKDIDQIEFDPMDLLNDQYNVAGNADEMTVRQDPENLDAFLRELSPYQSDEEPGERTLPAERESDIKDDEVKIDDIPKIDTDITKILPTLPAVGSDNKGTAPKTAPKTQTPATKESSGLDLSSLLALLSAGQQQQAPQAPRQKNSAEIELMKDIFGSTLNFD